MLKVTVIRDKWGRGGLQASYLLSPISGKMCCLGFAALAAGLTQETITGRGTVSACLRHKLISEPDLPESLGDLISEDEDYVGGRKFVDSDEATGLMNINDCIVGSRVRLCATGAYVTMVSEEYRESLLREYGLKAGIEFEFVD